MYTLQLTRSYKGEIHGTFRVKESNDSSRASFTWKTGQSYLLFLHRNEDGTWWVLGCDGNSDNVHNASRTIEVIKSLGTRHGGLIQGTIAGIVGPNTVRVHVAQKDGPKSFETAVDQHGEFRIHVPSGHYRLFAVLEGRSLEADTIMSYEDPENIVLVDGGCAQVVFEATPKAK